MSCWLLTFVRDYHCGLIGYQVKKKLPPIEPPQDSQVSPPSLPNSGKMKHVTLNHGMPNGGKTKPVTLNQNHHSIRVKAASPAGTPFQYEKVVLE